MARMLRRGRRTEHWAQAIQRYLVLSEFQRETCLAGGLPAERLRIKPNFAPDPGPAGEPGRGGLFVGRLEPEKGVGTLLAAWEQLAGVARLTVGGAGSLAGQVAEQARRRPERLAFAGSLTAPGVLQALREAAFLVMPSLCYETCPRVIIEAFSLGRPVLASRLGAMAEMVQDGVTGLLFAPGDPADLAEKARGLLANPERLRELGRAARRVYEERFSPQRNWEMLREIYAELLAEARAGRAQD